MTPKFHPGRVVATRDALHVLDRFNVAALELLGRHLSGDWGDLCSEDKAANDAALESGQARLLSAYTLRRTAYGVEETDRLWVITEWDRSVTTILRPSEY
ncbi:MAG: hypothetical protein J0L58_13785 [Burkholderiales bacterium]|nr:hypothetical protein [Burkholderiales bacterium]